jgi:hypothetical protein
MREKTSHILRSYFKSAQNEGDEESQKKALLETAARLIKSDIKSSVSAKNDQYPTTEMLKLQSAVDYIPESLRVMLDLLFVGKESKRKVASIGQSYKLSDHELCLVLCKLVLQYNYINCIAPGFL